MALVPVDHDNVAVLVFRQHRIAGHHKGNGLLPNGERQFDLAEALRRDLLVFRLDHRAGADTAHDRHRIQVEVIDDGLDFTRLDQADIPQNFRHCARAHAHGGRQTALGLARLLEPPHDRPDIQHGATFQYGATLPNFGREINYDYQKKRLTFNSEYRNIETGT